jgi:hypothetical protein
MGWMNGSMRTVDYDAENINTDQLIAKVDIWDQNSVTTLKYDTDGFIQTTEPKDHKNK